MLAKAEMVHNEQFLLVPQCFKMSSTAEARKGVCICKRVKYKHSFSSNVSFGFENTFDEINIVAVPRENQHFGLCVK